MGAASDPYSAAKKIEQQAPDVISLDIEMPRMDGLTFLKKIMSQHPIPVVVCSSLTVEKSDTALKAMKYGAVEIITKPKVGTKAFLEESKVRICDAVKAAHKANIKKFKEHIEVVPKHDADAVLSRGKKTVLSETTDKIIVIGASTGGTEAIRILLEALPKNTPGIVIVQHMPENFTRSFAERLNDSCMINVEEAANNATVLTGKALIAPGNKHTLLKRSGARYYTEIKGGPMVNRHRPSVDVLFRSASRYAGNNALGILLTGMGDDGARGLKELRDSGAATIAQDKDTCVVFGMPQVAIKTGAVEKVLSLRKIPAEIVSRYAL